MKNGKYCILIADDEKEIRDILRLLLEGEGYAVLTAEDGREAIAEAAHCQEKSFREKHFSPL